MQAKADKKRNEWSVLDAMRAVISKELSVRTAMAGKA